MTGQDDRGASAGTDSCGRVAVLGAVLSLVIGTAAGAEGLTLSGSAKNRLALFESQKSLLDGRLSVQYENSARLKPQREVEGDDGTSPRFAGSYRGEYLAVAKAMAAKHGIPEDMFLRLVQQESGWNPGAVSSKGAMGLAQLMPGTAALLGVDAKDPHQNLDGGARYLRMMFDKFGSWRLALAAYNAGPQAVEKYGGIPPYAETEGYVTAILG
jgi:soluble lytic murein transglycosylase-like protein